MMILKSYLFKRVAIIGVGLMGGSLGMAIRKLSIAREVIGISHRQSSLVEAMKNKAIDVAMTDLPKGVRNADLVVLATPIDSIIKLLININPHLKRGCIVTDVGSAKVDVVEAAQNTLSQSNFFVGSHPLTGSEKKGVQYASAEIFEGARCIITPTDATHQVAREKVKQLWTKLGSNVFVMLPKEHDEILAHTSHLPHLLACGLIESLPEKSLNFASGGLKDSTRIASASSQMWNAIFMANSKNVLNSLDEYIKRLAFLRKVILSEDEKSLIQFLDKAKQKRDALDQETGQES